ncbi:MAG TPA: ATP-binding cassette domain-containing protein, partial [Chthoniobacteraceae bacterium]|nr:ATP-binding cassette domain-containing protein [Chthoniobacteraceae bacterium]
MSIEIRNIGKAFGKYPALKDTNLDIPTGQLVALLGPSGSGKTTLLRIIAGLEFPDTGRVLFDGDDVTRKSAHHRRAGFVFQHYALFQHMTVADNIAFGLRVRPRNTRPSASEIRDRVHALLCRVGLEAFGKRFPAQLSGGQRQRIGLARALAIEPRVLLLDEPFAALDAKVRKEMRRWLREILEETKLTSLFVTHDQDEAFEVADRVVVLGDGLIQQDAPPAEIRTNPANFFVND